MATGSAPSSRLQLTRKVREQFFDEAKKALLDMGNTVQERLTALIDEFSNAREAQVRRDIWNAYKKSRPLWVESTVKAWRECLDPPVKKATLSLASSGLELVGTEVVENKILASRMVLAVNEKVLAELDDLRIRIKYLEGTEDLASRDLLRPEVLVLLMVEQWTQSGMPNESWPMVNDAVQRILIECLSVAYKNANELLIRKGVMPTIELKDRVKAPSNIVPNHSGHRPSPVPAPQGHTLNDHHSGYNSSGYNTSGFTDVGHHYPPGQAANYPHQRVHGYPSSGFGLTQPPQRENFAGAYGSAQRPAAGVPGPQPNHPGHVASYHATAGGKAPAGTFFSGRLGWGGGGGGVDITPHDARPMSSMDPHGFAASITPSMWRESGTSSTPGLVEGEHAGHAFVPSAPAGPLARAQRRARGVIGQIRRIFISQGWSGPAGTEHAHHAPSPGLVAALAQRDASYAYSESGTEFANHGLHAVTRIARDLREKSTELKKKAETKGEKATIEIVALMFQAILAEERIPPGIRVWFARLQIPVLRVALEDPDFFGTATHPARMLIDRMGSCVMGFDTAGVQDGVMETEIKRIVQVIEQYPETGKRVYQIVFDEFQKFLAKFLSEKGPANKVVGVAQQVEQKETLAIQYTIEMRNMLRDMPVREEIRDFLFKVWAEVLAVAALRKGPKHDDTLVLKKSATDLLWAASAKPQRTDRARVIKELPKLLLRLRSGMSLLSMSASEQEAHIKRISDTLADAFMSKTQAIPQAKIDAMAKRLGDLEDFVSEDGVGDLPLDSESIEMMLGIDASAIEVVAQGGSKPSAAMLAWAQELQIGSWYTLDYNQHITQVQFAWRSERKHLHLFAASSGRCFLIQTGRLAAYLQAGLLLPQEEEALTIRATRDALAKLEANPERLLS